MGADLQQVDCARTELTVKELEVMRLVAQGKSAKQIGLELCCGKRTVEYHIRRAYAKLGVSNKIRAIICAGLI